MQLLSALSACHLRAWHRFFAENDITLSCISNVSQDITIACRGSSGIGGASSNQGDAAQSDTITGTLTLSRYFHTGACLAVSTQVHANLVRK